MILGFGNNVVSSIAEDLTAGQTTIQVMPGAGAIFEGLLVPDFENKSTPLKTYAKITLSDAGATVFEVCHLTSVSGDVLNVIRGQEGTLAKGWSLNDVIANFATRGSESSFAQIAQLQAGTYTAGTAGGTANALTMELPSTFFANGSTDWELKVPIVVYPIHNNTGASTLQLTMGGKVLGVFPIYKNNLDPLDAGDILKDVGFTCLLDSTKSFFTIIGVGVGALPATDYKPRPDSLRGDVPAIQNKDMDTCLPGEFGLYETSSCAHSPTGAGNWFYCETKSINYDGSLIQLAWPFAGVGVLAWRNWRKSTEDWDGNWREAYDTGNKPTPADIGAAPTVHSHDWSQVGAPPRVAGGYGEIIPAGEYAQLLTQSGFFNNSGGLGDYGDPFPGQWAYFFHNSHGNSAGYCGSLAMNFDATQLRYSSISNGLGSGWKTIFTSAEPPEISNIPGLQGALDGKAPSTHTHPAAQGNADIIAGSWNAVGATVMARRTGAAACSPGERVAGSALLISSASASAGGALPGTWQCQGIAVANSGYVEPQVTTWIRVA